MRELPQRLGAFALRRLHATYGPGAWFPLSSRVRVLTTPTLSSRFIPDADIVVATSWTTSEWIAKFPESKGKKVYWVQDYEHIMISPPGRRMRILRSYQNPFHIVVISPALRDLLAEQGIPSVLIPNAIDQDTYFAQQPVSSAGRRLIGFPYRHEPYKGTFDVLKALERIRIHLKASDSIWAFGSDRGFDIPSWVVYHRHPSDGQLAQLYNQTKVFVVGSHFEGWGLPGLEAMACGAALVSTNTGGVTAYALHEVNALLSAPKRPDLLASNIQRLLDNDYECRGLATAGIQEASHYAWSTSVQKATTFFTTLLEEACRG